MCELKEMFVKLFDIELMSSIFDNILDFPRNLPSLANNIDES